MAPEMVCHRSSFGGLAFLMPNADEHLRVEPFAVIGQRHVVDGGHVQRLDHRLGPHVAEQRDLLPFGCRHLAVAAAKQDVGLDADRAQFLDRVLRRLGLELPGAGDERHQGEVDEDRIPARQLVAELADGLEERQALDVAHRAADLHQHEVDAVVAGGDESLDGIGDVRDHLHGAAEIVAAPLARQDLLVDAARGDVVGLLRRHAGEALVVAEIEVGLRPVVRHEHLTVLVRAHGAGIDVEVGVELPQADRIAARLKECPEGR